MRTPHGHAVAYNAQTAVDAKHKLIAAFDLTNEGNDYGQLHPMAVQGKEAVGADEVTVVADTGYSNGEHGAQCEQDKITAIVPRPETVNPKGTQYFSRDQFSYDRESDNWRCPAGATLSLFKTSHTQKKKEYTSRACGTCALKPQLPPGSSMRSWSRRRRASPIVSAVSTVPRRRRRRAATPRKRSAILRGWWTLLARGAHARSWWGRAISSAQTDPVGRRIVHVSKH